MQFGDWSSECALPISSIGLRSLPETSNTLTALVSCISPVPTTTSSYPPSSNPPFFGARDSRKTSSRRLAILSQPWKVWDPNTQHRVVCSSRYMCRVDICQAKVAAREGLCHCGIRKRSDSPWLERKEVHVRGAGCGFASYLSCILARSPHCS